MQTAFQRLDVLAGRPPQVLLVEGGRESDRLAAAMRWAKSFNCQQALAARNCGEQGAPCGNCPVCRQIEANEYPDLFIYDGRISNRQDEEKPGPVRALRMENMRELKRINSEAPRGNGKRIAIFMGMGQTREEAMNSLLKTLEEPSPHTLFVLLAPQRAQLLPTLVSRSHCITLPWADENLEAADQWIGSLGEFLDNGQGFLDKIAAKNAIDPDMAAKILLACQRALVNAFSAANEGTPLERNLKKLKDNPRSFAQLCAWIDEANRMLAANVSQARIMEAFAARLFCLMRQREQAPRLGD